MSLHSLVSALLGIFFLSVPLARAQSQWSGNFVQSVIGYGVVEQNTSQVILSGNVPLYKSALGKLTTGVGSLGFGHVWDIDDSLVVAAGVDVSPSASSSASFSANSPIGLPTTYGSTQFRDARNYYLSPGYLLSKEEVIYAKVGYAQVIASGSSALLSTSDTLSGLSLGLGYKRTIDDRLYGILEWKYVRFHAVTESVGVPYGGSTLMINSTGRPLGHDLIVGMGYRF